MATILQKPPIHQSLGGHRPVSASHLVSRWTDEAAPLTGPLPTAAAGEDSGRSRSPGMVRRRRRAGRRTSYVASPRQRILMLVATGLLAISAILGVAGVMILN